LRLHQESNDDGGGRSRDGDRQLSVLAREEKEPEEDKWSELDANGYADQHTRPAAL